jgi:hypothetical protein
MDDAAVLDLNDFFYFVQVVDRSGFTAAGRKPNALALKARDVGYEDAHSCSQCISKGGGS